MFRHLMQPFDSTPNAMEAPIALVLAAFVALLVFQAWALWHGQPFDVQGFGMALASTMGAGGAASYGAGYLIRSRGVFGGSLGGSLGGSARVDDPDGGA